MNSYLFIPIIIFGVLAYGSAIVQMHLGQYSPSFFSRAIWLLLGINSFAGVALGGGSPASKLLAATLLFGNAAVFVVSIKKGSREFGFTEKISLTLFGVSCVIWVTLDAALINLIIGLVAHFVGGIPTILRTIKYPRSEKALHWYFFVMASILTVIGSNPKTARSILFPVYFVCFDGLIIFLVNRQRLLKS